MGVRLQYDMVMLVKYIGRAAIFCRDQGHLAGHAQMADQAFTTVQMKQQVFRPAGNPFHPSAGEPFCKIIRQGDAKLVPSLNDPEKTAAFQQGYDAFFHGFNFGQFGHGLSLFVLPQPLMGLGCYKTCNKILVPHGLVVYVLPMVQESKQKDTPQTTHFGFGTVDKDAKQGLVRNVFDSVAGKYDIMNDVMSGGLHRLWKNDMIRVLHPEPGCRLLDMAGGTGDIAFRFLEAVNRRAKTDSKPAGVTVCDINPNMLDVGRDRAIDGGFLKNIEWVCGNAESLSFPDSSFEAYTIAFGMRNMTNMDKALAEAHRVLKPGGRFLCLEFSKVVMPILDKIYDSYSFHLLPRFGGMITGDRQSYQYLVESIRQFPPQENFKTLIGDAGFKRVSYRNMTGGIVALHSGWKI